MVNSLNEYPNIAHTHGSARVLYRRRSKSTERAKIRPLATPKPLNQSSPKFACVITSWTVLGTQTFVAISSRVFVPQIRDFAVLIDVTSVYVRFFVFFNKATAYIPERIFTKNRSNDVVPGKEVPF